jgi:hypothetical protein
VKRPNPVVVAVVAVLALAPACGSDAPITDPGLDGLAIESVDPIVVVPGTRIVVRGRSFVPADWGDSRLRLRGRLDGRELDVELDAGFVDYDRLEVAVTPEAFARLGGEGAFVGAAAVVVDSSADGLTHASGDLPLALAVRRELTPEVDAVLADGVIFVNEAIAVEGDGFLLGGDEGQTVAVLDGCFVADGETGCEARPAAEVALTPAAPFDRAHASFRFAPEIAGIRPGEFRGTVRFENRHAGGAVRATADADVAYALIEPAVFALGPQAASLGQFVDIEGGGFVGDPTPTDDDDLDGTTLLELSGHFTPTQGGAPVAVALTLVPDFVAGRLVRYVVNEDDQLGQAIDLRRVTGSFAGTVRPVVQWGGDEVSGEPLAVELAIAPVKQVVHLDFRPGYVESLRHFGLRALDRRIRARIADLVRRDYATINVDVRLEPPTDFALYAVVEVDGIDPNGAGLLGLDNTPGKDTDNLRLYDRIGGVNAVTQADGSAGYGGVFIESMFAFSEHPGDLAEAVDGQASPSFDEAFDPFRPDQGGAPVTSADLGRELPTVDGADCPSGGDRRTQIACAEYVLGNLIGTTLSHELGHSLGLANPYGAGFHDPFDEPNRLMDSGGARTFGERSELHGEGPARYCDEEYAYLRKILPTADATDRTPRPTCD